MFVYIYITAIREGLLNHFPDQNTGQEVAALEEGELFSDLILNYLGMMNYMIIMI